MGKFIGNGMIRLGPCLTTVLLIVGLVGQAKGSTGSETPIVQSLQGVWQTQGLRPSLGAEFFAKELAAVKTAYWNSSGNFQGSRAPDEVKSLCIHKFKEKTLGNGNKAFCMIRRWMISTKKLTAREVAKRVLFSDLLPHDTTVWADFSAKTINPTTCEQQEIPTTSSVEERLDYLNNWSLDLEPDSLRFWDVQVLESLLGTQAGLTYYEQNRLSDGTVLLTGTQAKAACGYEDAPYASSASATMVVPGRKSHLVYALSARCYDPSKGASGAAEKQINQIKQYSSKIHDMYCEDDEGKYKVLRQSLTGETQ